MNRSNEQQRFTKPTAGTSMKTLPIALRLERFKATIGFFAWDTRPAMTFTLRCSLATSGNAPATTFRGSKPFHLNDNSRATAKRALAQSKN
jgi:hypothetical protein